MQPKLVNNLVPRSAGDWTPGRGGHVPLYIVLHTTDCSLRQAEIGFANGARKASAHRIVGLTGSIIVEVADGDTSWGAANWPVNQAGFNLEHEDGGNYADSVRTPQEYDSSAWQVADWCRRFGIPCERGTVDANHMPTRPGIYVHQEVSTLGTSCPDGLDVGRIVAQAQQLLGGPTPPVVEASAASVGGVTAWGPAKVRVMVQTLRVHNSPSIKDAGNFANTPDGMLHEGNLADVNGWVRGDLVSQGGDTSDVWLHSPEGHYFWAADTDFFLAAPNLPLVAPPPTPDQVTPQAGTVTVTPDIGANIRTAPNTSANVVRAAEHGVQLTVEGFVSGADVLGNTKWWVLPDKTFVSGAVTTFIPNSSQPPTAPTAPTPPPAPVTVSVAQSLPGSGAGIAGDILPPDQIPAPTAPEQGADPMTVRDYLVAFVAWVMSPFIKK